MTLQYEIYIYREHIEMYMSIVIANLFRSNLLPLLDFQDSLVITNDRTKYNGTQLEMKIFALRIIIDACCVSVRKHPNNLRGVVSRNSIDHHK